MSPDEFEEQLEAALVTRPAIEQAKGILAAARRTTPEIAFEELSYVSQFHNVKLHDLATALIDAVAQRPVEDALFAIVWQEWNGVFKLS